MSRRAAIEDHVRGGGSICPFARPAAQRGGILFVEVPAGKNLQPVLWEAVKRFCRTWHVADVDHALVVVSAEDPPDWAAGRSLAGEWQEQILLAFTRVSYPKLPVAAAAALVKSDRADFLIASEARRDIHALPFYEPATLRMQTKGMGLHDRAQTMSREGGVYLLFAGPHYPADHFRHAPCFCAVLTWAREVYRAQDNEAAMRYLRTAMVQRYGGLYDAEAPYLDIVPEIKRGGPAR